MIDAKKVNEYLNCELLQLHDLPNDVIDSAKLAEGIVSRLFMKRYRKYSISSEVRENVTAKVNNIVANGLPMTFIPSFGGYKHWWSPTYPDTDWAEVFNMKFILQYLAPIFNSYSAAPVSIEYESEEVILSELNNVPQSGLDRYTDTFRKVAEHFNKQLCGKTEISLTLARDLYDVDELKRLIGEMYDEHVERFNSYDPDDQERRIQKVRTNFLLDGVVDYTNLSEEELYALYRHSRILNETFLDADFELRPNFFEGDSSIPLLFSFGLGPGGEMWIHIGSCATPMVDFWAGMGILEYWETEDKFVPRIISRSQYESIKDSLVRVEVTSPLNGISENYTSIYVYDGKLDFANKK